MLRSSWNLPLIRRRISFEVSAKRSFPPSLSMMTPPSLMVAISDHRKILSPFLKTNLSSLREISTLSGERLIEDHHIPAISTVKRTANESARISLSGINLKWLTSRKKTKTIGVVIAIKTKPILLLLSLRVFCRFSLCNTYHQPTTCPRPGSRSCVWTNNPCH